jgi:hypothetical protein
MRSQRNHSLRRENFLQLISCLYRSCNQLDRFAYYFIALLSALLVVALFYPGMFSNDTLSQWSQAVNDSYDNWHPAIMAIMMHILNPMLGIGGIFIVHQILYWASIAIFVDLIFNRNLLWFYAIGLFPPVFTISLSVFKDVGFIVSCMGAISLFILYVSSKKKSVLFLSLMLLLYAGCVRINGLAITAILVFCGALFLFKATAKRILISLFCVFCTFLITFSANVAINKVYDVREVNPIATLLLWDIAGVYCYSGQDRPPPKAVAVVDAARAKNWLDYYRSDTCSLCWYSGVSCVLPSKESAEHLFNFWFHEIKQQPVAYLKHRYELSKHLFGLNGKIFYAYHSWHQNERDLNSGEARLGDFSKTVFSKIEKMFYLSESLYLAQPFVWIIVEVIILLYGLILFCCRRAISLEKFLAFSLAFSGLPNAFTLIFISVAADYRYIVWTVLSGFLSVLLLVADHYQNRKTRGLRLEKQTTTMSETETEEQ